MVLMVPFAAAIACQKLLGESLLGFDTFPYLD